MSNIFVLRLDEVIPQDIEGNWSDDQCSEDDEEYEENNRGD